MKKINFDSAQQEAITTLDQHLCILAGAGCGKTTVLAQHYVQCLLQKNYSPTQIVAVTFTHKASQELKSAIEGFLQNQSLPSAEKIKWFNEIKQAPITTFHGLAFSILKENALLTQLPPDLTLLDESETEVLQQEAVQKTLAEALTRKDTQLKQLYEAYGFSKIRTQLLECLQNWPLWLEADWQNSTAEESHYQKILERLFKSSFQNYHFLKTQRRSLDFDDLESEVLKLFQQFPELISHYQQRWKVFLIDEFQDTSLKQHQILSYFLDFKNDQPLPKHYHLCIVGDFKQSIYAFRRAKPELFILYQNKIESGGGKLVYLTQNFRNPNSLIDWFNPFFQSIFDHYFPLQSDKQLPYPSLEVLSDSKQTDQDAESRRTSEAQAMALRIMKLLADGFLPEEIFILFRSTSAMTPYLKALQSRHLPVFVKSNQNFFKRQEIIDCLHALALSIDPHQELHWLALLRSPLFDFSDEEILQKKLNSNEKEFWHDWHPLIDAIASQKVPQTPYAFLNWLYEKSGWIELYATDVSFEDRALHLLQFLNFTFEWEQKNNADTAIFLTHLEKLQNSDKSLSSLAETQANQAITLMTIHQSKGLNLPVVFLPNLKATSRAETVPIALCFDGKIGLKLPKSSTGLKKETSNSARLEEILTLKKSSENAEEDRIFYVAVTRASKKLILGFLPEEKNSKILFKKELNASLQSHRSVDWISAESLLSHASIEYMQNKGEPSNLTLQQAQSKPSQQSLSIESHTLNQEIALRSPFQKITPIKTHFSVTELNHQLHTSHRAHAGFSKPVAKHQNETIALRGELSALEFGSLLHELLCELSRTFPKLPNDLQKTTQLFFQRHAYGKAYHTSLNGMVEILAKTLSHPNFDLILNSRGYAELPFLLSIPPYEIQGAIDWLMQETPEKWKVVDYKTHRFQSWNEIKSELPSFEFQLKTYCLAASKLLKKPVLEGLLYFIVPNLTHTFSFTETDLTVHAEFLKSKMGEVGSPVN